MPEYHQVETVHGLSQDKILVVSFGSFRKLGWTLFYAEPGKIAAMSSAPGGQMLTVEIAPSTIIVKSEMVNNEKWDLRGTNRKNVEKFLSTFNSVAEEANELNYLEWEAGLSKLQEQTLFAVEEERKEEESLDRVMNFSKGSMTITYVIMGLNIAVFIWMVAMGVNIFQPSVEDLAKWGGNFRPLTTGGEWWRLLTAVFIHSGIIHMALNMYALLMVSMYLEPILGKVRFLAAYIASGLLASLISLWWNGNNIISVGASGAIFGLYGVFLALLSAPFIPSATRNSLLTSIGVFVLYNLVYGASSKNIDNAAHLGGLATGLLIGYSFLPFLKKQSGNKEYSIAGIVLMFSVLVSSIYLINVRDDSMVYERKINEIMVLQEDALTALEFGNPDDLMKLASTVSQPKWQEAKIIIDETKEYTLNATLANHRNLMSEYIDLRIQQVDLFIIALRGRENVDDELKAIIEKINAVTSQMEKPAN